MAEARKFSDQKDFQDALLIYNQALSQATTPRDRERVLAAVKALLPQTPAQAIESFLSIKNLSIPKAILRFYAGQNHANQGNHAAAKRHLQAFMSQYPDHPLATQAGALLDTVKQAVFKRDVIGVLLPLSGKYKVFGERALKGIQMAVQDMSMAQGRAYRVVVKDTRSDAGHAGNCVDELAQQEVMGIVGPLLAPEAAGDRAQELGIPLIALTQKTDFPVQGDYLFSNFITPKMQVQALGAYVFMELGLEKVAILYPDEKYGKTYMELFWDVVDEFNASVVGVESYDGSNTDFSLPLQKLTGEAYPVPEFLLPDPEAEPLPENEMLEPEDQIDAAQKALAQEDQDPTSVRGSAVANTDRIQIDFQALFIPDSLSRVNLILPQLAFHDARGMVLLGTNLWHNDSLLTQAKGYNKNAVITAGYFGDSKNPVTADFHRRFGQIFGNSPGFLEAISYDTAKILFTAGLSQKASSRNDIKEILQGRQFFEGATGRTIFDKTGSPHKELFLITVKQETFKEIRQ
jgi:ABC-type branched-subunit amino acid transport system substrate-binding protein